MENKKNNNIEKEMTTVKVHKETREELKNMKEFGKSDAIRIDNILKEFSKMRELIIGDVKEVESSFEVDASKDIELILNTINSFVGNVVSGANQYIEAETKKRIENALKDFDKQSKVFDKKVSKLRDTLEADVDKLNRDLTLKASYIAELEKENREKDDLIEDYKRKNKTYSELNAKYEASQQALKRETYKTNDLEIEVKETAKLKIEKANLEAEVKKLKEENKTLSIDFSENKALKAELEALKNATQYVNLTIENFIKEKVDLQNKLEEEKTKNDSLAKEKEELLKQIEQLKNTKNK